MTKSKQVLLSELKASARHVLQWTVSPQFESTMNGLLKDTGATLHTPDHRYPDGRRRPLDPRSVELEEYLVKFPMPDRRRLARDWWVPYPSARNRYPDWDLLCQIDVAGTPGILLVHAIADTEELRQHDRRERPDPTQPLRLANDYCVRLRLADANRQLAQLDLGNFQLSADHRYGISWRIAFLHKLAAEGIPVVLMYLGWLQPPEWATSHGFQSAEHWDRVVRDHMRPVAPEAFLDRWLAAEGGGAMRMIARSMPVHAQLQAAAGK